MFLQLLSATWKAIAPALADHLWQSTLFAAAAGLLTVALRRNSARVRYAVWLIASLKFMVPFSLLVAAGTLFSWRHMPVSTAGGMYMVEVVGQPFTKSFVTNPAAVSSPAGSTTLSQLLPLLLCVWWIGFLAVLCIGIVRWRRVAISLRNSHPLTEERENSILERLQQLHSAATPIKLMRSETSLEPGVFGIFHPVLLWPRSVSDHLDDAHLEAVIAHELCHVRRRDNLAAVLHMLVEAVFWFHPLVWWIGAQLIAERERACDEAVIELGSHRHTYAESILKVCEFCLSSPLTCVSGVTGADLKKRMVQIMTDRVVRKLNFARKLLLWTAACLAIALPIAFGIFNVTPIRAESPSQPAIKFSSVSIQPHSDGNSQIMMAKVKMMTGPKGLDVTGVPLHMLIRTTYQVQEAQLLGEPEWARTQRYDIEGKIDPQVAAQMRSLSEDQAKVMNQQMMRQLLVDYFKLSVHQESRDLPVYELVQADGGTKLQKSVGTGIALTRMGLGELDSKGAPLSILSAQLSEHLGRTIVDKTGLQGTYAFDLHWTPDSEEMARLRALAGGIAPMSPGPGMQPPSPSGPDLITAVQEQLGLKLQPATERVPVLVVDHIEQPAQK